MYSRRDAHVVEEDLALVERPLAHLVERLAARDAGKVEGTTATPPPGMPCAVERENSVSACVAIVPLETQAAFWPLSTYSSPSRRAKRFPLMLRSWKIGCSRDERVRAVVGLGDRPAADKACRRVRRRTAAAARRRAQDCRPWPPSRREPGDADRDGEIGAAPAQLFEEDVLLEAAEAEAAHFGRQHHLVVAETVGLTEHVPERRIPRDDALGVGATVELGRPRSGGPRGQTGARSPGTPSALRSARGSGRGTYITLPGTIGAFESNGRALPGGPWVHGIGRPLPAIGNGTGRALSRAPRARRRPPAPARVHALL